MADVFISYATEDRQRVKPIVEAIEQAGFSVTSALNDEIIGMAVPQPVLPGYALFHLAWHE
jgi:hypothetical protein